MKAIKKLISVWLVAFVYSGVLFEAGASSEKPISLQIQNLTRWKNSREAPAVQQSLRAILNPRQNYPRVAETIEGVRQYSALFKKPFLLLEAEPNDFGGFFALVVFKEHPKVLRLWVYEIDKGVFEIRETVPLQVTLNKRIMSELADKRITPFWLSSLSQ